MATVYALPLAITGEDKTLEFTCKDPADFGPGVTTPVARGEETLYKFVSGDPAHPTTMRVGSYEPGPNSPTKNSSVKVRTIGTKTNDDATIEYFPFEVTVAIADGSLGQLDRADVAALLMMAVSAYIEPAGVANEASVTALSRLAFGVSDILNVTFA